MLLLVYFVFYFFLWFHSLFMPCASRFVIHRKEPYRYTQNGIYFQSVDIMFGSIHYTLNQKRIPTNHWTASRYSIRFADHYFIVVNFVVRLYVCVCVSVCNACLRTANVGCYLVLFECLYAYCMVGFVHCAPFVWNSLIYCISKFSSIVFVVLLFQHFIIIICFHLTAGLYVYIVYDDSYYTYQYETHCIDCTQWMQLF